MPAGTYEELNERFMELYQKGDYAAALALYDKEGERFPESEAEVLYLRSCMAARTGQPYLAIDIIRQALDSGHWYGHVVMRRSPSWEPLQGMPEFERLVEECERRQVEASRSAQLLVLEPEGGCSDREPCPAIIALHGNASTGESAIQGWRPVVEQGFLLAAVQSSQAATSNTFVWDDQEIALRDVASEFDKLRAERTIDAERLVIAGFSLGAETALLAALRGTIPARGFILLGPGGVLTDTPEDWLPIIQQANAEGRQLRGYIFIGDIDNQVLPDAISKLANMLNAHGFPCELEILPGMRHEYPPDWAAGLKRALAFVLE